MNHPVTPDERFVLARRLGRIAAEIRALGDGLLRLPADADDPVGPNAAEQRALGLFLGSACHRTPGAQIPGFQLYEAYRTWANQAEEEPVSHKKFALLLKQRGFQKYRRSTGVVYLGLGLRSGDHGKVRDGS
jgi:hypothetical protein